MLKQTIEKWLTETINQSLWTKNNDLHINEISSKYKKPNSWILGGIECLETAISIRDRLRVHFLIQLFVELKSEVKPIGVNFTSLKELENELTTTPPSLYLYQYNETENEILKKGQKVSFKEFGQKNFEIYYFETLKDYPEYFRSLKFISLP